MSVERAKPGRGGGIVIGLDITPVEPSPGATVLAKDFYDDDAPAVLMALLKAAEDRGDARVQAHTTRSSRGFFERHGFVATGEPFETDGVAYTTLRHDLVR